ncbi:MAG: hypothetical protein ACJ790_10865 [Myxococcaceae bacterium]
MVRNIVFTALLALALSACGSSGSANGGTGGGAGGPGGATGGGTGGGTGGTGGGSGGGTGGGAGGGGGTASVPTWYHDVQPIVHEHCETCHRPGDIAPFPLTNYQEAFAQNFGMASAVQSRVMPPWLPTDTCQQYKDSRALSQADIDTIAAWSAGGAPEGDPADAQPQADGGAGELPWVDMTVQPDTAYTPFATSADDYHCFPLGSAFAADEDVIGFQILPGERREVHHVILFEAPSTDVAAKGSGWTCYGDSGINGANLVGGWAPGTPPTTYPSGTGVHIAAGHQLVMQVHYNLSNVGGIGVADQTAAKLQFSTTPIPSSGQARILPVVNSSFQIPPADANGNPGTLTSDGTQSNPAPFPLRLWGVFPHMHQLGTHIKVSLDGSNTCFADIPKWDFHWQQMYLFQQPVTIPSNASIRVSCSWSNPTSRTVTWGESTTDEMCLSYLYLTF